MCSIVGTLPDLGCHVHGHLPYGGQWRGLGAFCFPLPSMCSVAVLAGTSVPFGVILGTVDVGKRWYSCCTSLPSGNAVPKLITLCSALVTLAFLVSVWAQFMWMPSGSAWVLQPQCRQPEVQSHGEFICPVGSP